MNEIENKVKNFYKALEALENQINLLEAQNVKSDEFRNQTLKSFDIILDDLKNIKSNIDRSNQEQKEFIVIHQDSTQILKSVLDNQKKEIDNMKVQNDFIVETINLEASISKISFDELLSYISRSNKRMKFFGILLIFLVLISLIMMMFMLV